MAAGIRKSLQALHPDKPIARIKVWLVGDKFGRNRDSIMVEAPVPDQMVKLLSRLCLAVANKNSMLHGQRFECAVDAMVKLLEGGSDGSKG